MDWYAAIDYCRNIDGYLAEILDNETQYFLTKKAQELPPTNWWLGATDIETVSNGNEKNESMHD